MRMRMKTRERMEMGGDGKKVDGSICIERVGTQETT